MKASLFAITLGVGAIALSGCSDNEQAATAPGQGDSALVAEQPVRISGSLAYRARIALIPDSEALVEVLRNADELDDTEVLAEQRIELQGRQVPIDFELEVEPGVLTSAGDYVLRASILEAQRQTWSSEPTALTLGEPELVLGELLLLPQRAKAMASILHCGRLQISAGYDGENLILDANGKQQTLLPVVSASGAKFEAEGDPSTSFWSKGDTAMLTLNGQDYPLCAPPGEVVEPFKASGNEPFWHLEADNGELTLRRLGDEAVFSAAYTQAAPERTTRVLQAEELQATVVEQLCQDSMSGMSYPQQVSVSVAGGTLVGCGGDPQRLLSGVEWVVEDMNGGGIIDRSRATIQFMEQNRVAGRASCNNYMGEYSLTGEGLTLSKTATTMKACAPSLMEQEQRFLALLDRVQRFEFVEDGALILHTSEDETLTARLE